MTDKKVLLFSHTFNYRQVDNWMSLLMWYRKKEIEKFLDREVDILSWFKYKDHNDLFAKYDTLVLIDNLVQPYYDKSKHRKYLFDFLAAFSGKKYIVFPHEGRYLELSAERKRILDDFRINDLSADFNVHLDKMHTNIVFGDEVALNLWDLDTKIWMTKLFVFPCDKLYDTATVYFSKFDVESLAQMQTMLDNLFIRMNQIHAKEIAFVLPEQIEHRREEFFEYLFSKLLDTNFKVYKSINHVVKREWKNSLWDYKNDRRREIVKYEEIFEPYGYEPAGDVE